MTEEKSLKKPGARPKLEPGCLLLADYDLVHLYAQAVLLWFYQRNESGSSLRLLRVGQVRASAPLNLRSFLGFLALPVGQWLGVTAPQQWSPGGLSPLPSGSHHPEHEIGLYWVSGRPGMPAASLPRGSSRSLGSLRPTVLTFASEPGPQPRPSLGLPLLATQSQLSLSFPR